MRRAITKPSRRRPSTPFRAAIVAALCCNVWASGVIAQSTLTAPTTSPAVSILNGEIDPSRLMADQVAAAARQMIESTGEQEPRDLAARRLLQIGTNDARTALVNALRDLNNPGGRLAAARAVTNDNPPGPEFVDPLFVLLDTEASPPLMEAAAVALGNYKASPDVTVRLVGLTDPQRSAAVRLAAIRGLSTQIEKRAASRLVDLAQEAATPAIATAAMNALQAFTVYAYDNPADWAAWWRTQTDVTDDRFRIETLVARMNRAQQMQKLGDETYQALSLTVAAALNAAPREQRGDVFARYLKSPREVERLIAIRRAYDYASDPFPTLPTMAREMLADVSPEVRYEAARIVQALVDNGAFAALAQQASVEPDARVRAKIADALGTLGNVDALPLLRTMLDDASNLVVQSAAGALERLGPAIVQSKPAEAEDLSIRLQRLLAGRAARGNASNAVVAAGGGSLRDSVVAALVPLKQRSLRFAFRDMLAADAGESAAVRESAARGLGEIGESETVSPLVEALGDSSAKVRVAAVRAIGQVSRDDFSNAERLYQLLNPASESDPQVRLAAWEVIRSQLPTAPLVQLAAWPDKPLLQRDDEKRVQIYGVLARRYGDENKPGLQIDALQHVGESQMNLGETAERADDRDNADRHFGDAAQTLNGAITLAKRTGEAMYEQSLTEMRMRALLRARDYLGAATFIQSLPREYQEVVGPLWKLEGDRLTGRKTADDDASALALIAAANGLSPGVLSNQHRELLNSLQAGIQRRQNEKNQFAVPDWMRAVCMR